MFDFLGAPMQYDTYNVPNPGITGANITSGKNSIADVTGQNAASVAQPGMTWNDLLDALQKYSAMNRGGMNAYNLGAIQNLNMNQNQKKSGSSDAVLGQLANVALGAFI